jgi:hypothetical protein
MKDSNAPSPVVDTTITVETLLIGCCPRLKGFITEVILNPKCKHDWEAHRVHSAQVRFVFGRLDATTIRRAAEAGRQIREEQTEAVAIRKIGERI